MVMRLPTKRRVDKMGKSTISPEVVKIIRKSVDEAGGGIF